MKTQSTHRSPELPVGHGRAVLTEGELAAVAGGIIILPKSPPLGWRPPASDPVPPAGGYIP